MNTLYQGDNLTILRNMPDDSVQVIITSPPYYNAREYSQWDTLDSYLKDMSAVIQECYRVLDNHRPIVWNVGDIYDNDNRITTATWGKRRIPLGAYFTLMLEKHGFHFVDDFIWDKGEVQSQRHKNGDKPYPLYQYPINCYEHILIFYKHRLDKTPCPCPVCGETIVVSNSCTRIGVQSWECKNPECSHKSPNNRGKRFSARSNQMKALQKPENRVYDKLLQQWRRDIIKLTPVIKINSKKENIVGHTAPFPLEIPLYATSVFTGVGETVLDPFCGSGTALDAAQTLGRQWIGIDQSDEAINVIQGRLRDRHGLEYDRDYELITQKGR